MKDDIKAICFHLPRKEYIAIKQASAAMEITMQRFIRNACAYFMQESKNIRSNGTEQKGCTRIAMKDEYDVIL